MTNTSMSPACPPGTSREISSFNGATLETVSETRGPRAPATAPRAAAPTHHPAKVERCRRHANPTNDVPPTPARSLPSRWGRRLAPTSRRRRISTAATATPSAAARRTGSANRSGLVNGRNRWPQPIGDSSDGHALLTCSRSDAGVPSASPTPRNRYAAPTRPAAAPFALLPEGMTWATAAAKPTKNTPTAPTAAPAPTAPGTGSPAATKPAARNMARIRFAAAPRQKRRCQGRCPRERNRAEDFGPSELFIGAGVPHHKERAHQSRQHGRERETLEEHDRPNAGAVGQAAEEKKCRVRSRQGQDRCLRGLVTKLRDHRAGGRKAEQRDAQDPDRQCHPVPACLEQCQPQHAGHHFTPLPLRSL